MSAYIVSDHHINALMTFALKNELCIPYKNDLIRIENAQSVEEVGRILLDENIRSVHHRYGKKISSEEKTASSDYTFKHVNSPLAPMQIVVACDCFDYQASETNNYDQTLANKIIQTIRKSAIQKHPEWVEQKWSIDEGDVSYGRIILLSSLVSK